jgi:hypothetical protein
VSLRSEYALVCGCGHAGCVVVVESDRVDGRAWERYDLLGHRGFAAGAVNRYLPWAEAFQLMQPICGRCFGRLRQFDLVPAASTVTAADKVIQAP